jgi:hypothetical protein
VGVGPETQAEDDAPISDGSEKHHDQEQSGGEERQPSKRRRVEDIRGMLAAGAGSMRYEHLPGI